MNIILLNQSDFIDSDTILLKDHRKDHIIKVLQAEKNDSLECGLMNGSVGKGLITTINSEGIELKVTLDTKPPPPLPLTLILALPRPKMLRRIIESAASLGVKKIYLINSWRVEKSFWQSPVLNDESLNQILIKGLEQAKDTIMPEIYIRKLFTPFVKGELPGIAKGSICFTAHPKTDAPCPSNLNQKTCLAIGPEGGFIDLEVETFENIGFKTISIGRRILRTETAVPLILSKLFPKFFN